MQKPAVHSSLCAFAFKPQASTPSLFTLKTCANNGNMQRYQKIMEGSRLIRDGIVQRNYCENLLATKDHWRLWKFYRDGKVAQPLELKPERIFLRQGRKRFRNSLKNIEKML